MADVLPLQGWADGYYVARHGLGMTFVVLREDGAWFAPGIEHPIAFDPAGIVGRVSCDPIQCVAGAWDR